MCNILYFGAPIALLSSQVLNGANAYHSATVFRQGVDFGTLAEATSSVAGPGLAPSFLDRFVGLRSFFPKNGISDEFINRLRSPEGVGFPELLLEAILAVESVVAFATHELCGVSYAAVERNEKGVDLTWASANPKFSPDAAEVGLLGLIELLPEKFQQQHAPPGPDFAAALDRLRTEAQRSRLAPSTAVIKLAAYRRGIPCEIKGRQHLLLGQGQLQHHIYASMTATTSITAQKICADKHQTYRRLSDLRLPVPQQVRVGTLEAALAGAERIGFPVVIKPRKGKKGAGITVGLTSAKDIEQAFDLAHVSGSDVLIQRLVPGGDYRMLVIGGKFAAAVRRDPPTITGNGVSTVAELIAELNSHPYRDGFRGFPVIKDAEFDRMLEKAGLILEDVPAQGVSIALRAVANVSTGGTPTDVTDEVHPDNRSMAERAAAGVGLDVAGVDFLTTDIGRSYREIGGGIVEINARPGLDIHIWPMAGQSRNVAEQLLELALPPSTEGRIPIVGVAGDEGTGTVARALDMLLRGAGRSVALSLRSRAFVNGQDAELSAAQQAKAPLALVQDPQIDTLVSTLSLRQTVKRGMLLDSCSVMVVLDRVKAGGAGLFRQGLDIAARATTDCLVVGTRDTLVLRRLAGLEGKRIILVSDRAEDEAFRAQLEAGQDGVTTGWHEEGIRILLYSGSELVASFPPSIRSFTGAPTNRSRRTTALMYAVAAAHGLGLSPAQIGVALSDAPVAVPAAA